VFLRSLGLASRLGHGCGLGIKSLVLASSHGLSLESPGIGIESPGIGLVLGFEILPLTPSLCNIEIGYKKWARD
jgi:hypothetical protein